MKDHEKTKEQLVKELTELRSQNAVLEKTRKELAVIKIATDEVSEFAENIINTVREPLIALDQDLKVVKVNSSFCDFFKVSPEETVGQLIYNLGNRQWDIPKLRELLETILPEKATFDNYEVEHDFATIGRRTMLLNARQVQRVLGNERIILLAIEDITEHKRLEDLLKEAEGRYRHVFNTASDGIVLFEKLEGKITHANQAAEKMLGYSLEECVGYKLQDIGIVDIDNFQTLMQILDEIGITNYTNVPIKTKSGKHIDTDIYLANRAKLVQCNIRDISQRKQAEGALRESEERFRVSFERSTVGKSLTAPDGKLLRINKAFADMLGYTIEEIQYLNFVQITHPEDVAKSRECIRILLADEQTSYRFEKRYIHKSGHIVWGDVSTILFRDEHGAPLYLITSIVDITEQKCAEYDLKETLKKYRSLVDYVDSMYQVDRDCTFLFMNERHLKRFGLSLEEVVGKKYGEFHSEEDARQFAEYVREVCESGKAITKEHRSERDGGYFLRTFTPITGQSSDGNISQVTVFSKNITDIKCSEAQLQETLESLRRAVGVTIQVLASAVETRDPYTSGHQTRSANLARTIAMEMGLPQDKIEGIRMAGSIHDLGKISIPAEILSKPGKLSEIELALIKEHANRGYEMLKDVVSQWPLAEIVRQHHERTDGSGYPRNLKGDDILIEARILAVADVVEAMASHRPYRAGLGIDAALNEIEQNSGIFYDNAVADACLRLFREKGFKLEGT
jgi:PAS domain S-box-containing protein